MIMIVIKFSLSFLLSIALMTSSLFAESNQGFRPKEGFVPNALTASSIAEAVLIEIYGKQQIEEQKPFIAELIEDQWVLKGNFVKDQDSRGGVFTIKINKNSGEILFISHGK